MKWEKTDMEKYIDAKEYLDTAILPIQPFNISDDSTLIEDAFQREVLGAFSREIEKELSGRTVLIPTYNYLKNTELSTEVSRLNHWTEHLLEQPFKTVVYVTFDSNWRKYMKELNGELIWLPGIKTGDLKSKETQKLIKEQVEQITQLIKSFW